jgi:superfamily II DNA or RNA helicase
MEKKSKSKSDDQKRQCVRQIANLSVVKPSFKFDGKKFKPAEFLDSIDEVAPKVKALLDNIARVDREDMKKHGKTFKHFIFSDLSAQGDKLVAAALLTSGYKSMYGPSGTRLVVDDKALNDPNTDAFALLTATPVYGVKIGPQFKKQVLGTFNERPRNVHGERLRFLVLSKDFKEGIDLFDVKYAHVLEPQTTKANQKQVIGRGTRTCGQKGLAFIPSVGWPLYVFIYDTLLSKSAQEKHGVRTMHDLYLKGLDLRQFAFGEELDKYVVIASVDYQLNKTVHNFRTESDELPADLFAATKLSDMQEGGEAPAKTSNKVNCRGTCGKAPTPSVPATVADMLLAWLSLGRIVSKTKKERLREHLCVAMKRDPVLCERVNEAFDDKVKFVRKYKVVIGYTYSKLDDVYKRQIEKYVKDIGSKPAQPFVVKRELVSANFRSFAWPKAVMENLCEAPKDKPVDKKTEFKFTPTQDFLRNYFTPHIPEKGILLFHSTGSGKTCSAIATASSSFEDEGYTILWVTRTSLRSDIWKNQFDQVCNVALKAKLAETGKKLPANLTDRKRLLSKSWKIPPISYKQFTNLITKKNRKLYDDLTKINGTTDPLRKTLLVIDEAHKLYGGDDLIAQERPDTGKLSEMIQHSYKTSGADSVKLLLMTATPYTKEPMEMIKLVNLMRETPMPDTFDAFQKAYLEEDGTFTKRGKLEFLNGMSGYVSYLNRELDARQFAQPQVTNVLVPMSERALDVDSKAALAKKYKELAKKHDADVKDLQDQKKQFAQEVSAIGKAIKELPKCTGIKDKEERRICKDAAEKKKQQLKDQKEDLQDQKRALDDTIAEVGVEKRALAKAKKEEAERLDNDASQERMLGEKCKL